MKVVWKSNRKEYETFIPDDQLGECESREQIQNLINEYILDNRPKYEWEIVLIEE